MGLNVSTQIADTVVENVTKSTVSTLQSIAQSNEGNVDINQQVRIVINGTLTCASLDITQDAQVSMKALNEASAEQILELTNQVTQSLKENVKNETEQQNKGLNPLQSNVSTVVNSAVESTVTEQQVAVEQVFDQTIVQSSTVSQLIELIVGDNGQAFINGPCVFNQSVSIEYVANNCALAAISVVLANESVQQAMIEWDNYVKQSNEGLSVGAIIGIVIAIIVVIVAIALAIKYGVPAAKKAKAAKAAKAAEMLWTKKIRFQE